ncbi:hypothetical protein [Streptomyces sp. NPDC057426]|uniref:hypothetical protein n=1 Tax=Streptomyces sp. NPDC057426 TaxID=3346128 RepID=UPI00368D4D5C
MSTLTNSGDDWIRGLTVRQPWAAAILTGAKTIENRPRASWRPGWVLLHAGKSIDRWALSDQLVANTIRGRELVTGAVVGVARITGAHQDPDGTDPCSPWALPSMWHLEITDVHELTEPIPVAGQLGPWRPSPDLVARVLCGTTTPLRSHTSEPVRKTCAEAWNAENPGEARFVSDPPKGWRSDGHA